MYRFATLSALVMVASCGGGANHLGNPLLWPVYAVSSGVDNAIYDSRRDDVEDHVTANHDTLLNEIEGGGGPVLNEAMNLALIPEGSRNVWINQVQSDLAIYENDPEALVVALMVYGG